MGARGGGDHGAVRGRVVRSEEEMLQSIHTSLYNEVGEACAKIAHLETSWKQTELTRRIVRYIYNSAKSPELAELHWREASKKLVEQAMHGYCSACQEKRWFYEIDLAPAFTVAAWEILSSRGQRVRYAELEDLIISEYEEMLDRTMLQKAMWECTEKVFGEGSVRSKVYNAISRAWPQCLVDTDTRPRDETQKVEQFTKRWITDSMQRAWCSVENPERTITTEKVLRLFSLLMAPFGKDHGFSCIPMTLTETQPPPPREWEFIQEVVEQLFRSWQQESLLSSSSSSRKRKSRRAAAPSAEDVEMEEAPPPGASKASRQSYEGRPARTAYSAFPGGRDPRASSASVKDGGEEAGHLEGSRDEDLELGEGHPECTSVEDCIGHRNCRLVRHQCPGELGDIYCEMCWESFLMQNRQLQGIWQDGEFAGEQYVARH